MSRLLGAVLIAAGLGACSSTTKTEKASCAEGEQRACACPGGGQGAQVCLPDQTFGSCDCTGAGGAGGGSGGTSGSSGASGAGGAAGTAGSSGVGGSAGTGGSSGSGGGSAGASGMGGMSGAGGSAGGMAGGAGVGGAGGMAGGAGVGGAGGMAGGAGVGGTGGGGMLVPSILSHSFSVNCMPVIDPDPVSGSFDAHYDNGGGAMAASAQVIGVRLNFVDGSDSLTWFVDVAPTGSGLIGAGATDTATHLKQLASGTGVGTGEPCDYCPGTMALQVTWQVGTSMVVDNTLSIPTDCAF